MSVEAAVAVTGTMQRYLVRVVSNPPLPEGETLSWLVLGRVYLAFEQNLGGTENLLRLEMRLTERIASRAQAGLTSSVGIYHRCVWH